MLRVGRGIFDKSKPRCPISQGRGPSEPSGGRCGAVVAGVLLGVGAHCAGVVRFSSLGGRCTARRCSTDGARRGVSHRELSLWRFLQGVRVFDAGRAHAEKSTIIRNKSVWKRSISAVTTIGGVTERDRGVAGVRRWPAMSATMMQTIMQTGRRADRQRGSDPAHIWG